MGQRTARPMALDPSPLGRFVKILAIDTVNWSSSVALWEDGHELAYQENRHAQDQAALLPQLVKDVLGNQKADLFLVNVGPGSFTGIRIGIAFAKGLSLGLGIPLKGINSFMSLYKNVAPQDDVLILLDAHRDDLFGMRFQKGNPGTPQSLTRKAIEDILASPSSPVLAGSGIHPFLDGLSFKEVAPTYQGARAVASAFFNDSLIATDPLPFYVREADVSFSSKS